MSPEIGISAGMVIGGLDPFEAGSHTDLPRPRRGSYDCCCLAVLVKVSSLGSQPTAFDYRAGSQQTGALASFLFQGKNKKEEK